MGKGEDSSLGWGSILVGDTHRTGYFESDGRAGSRSQTYELPSGLLGAFFSHKCKT